MTHDPLCPQQRWPSLIMSQCQCRLIGAARRDECRQLRERVLELRTPTDDEHGPLVLIQDVLDLLGDA